MSTTTSQMRIVSFLVILAPPFAYASDNKPRLESIERRVQRVYERTSPAIVRIRSEDDHGVRFGSGVIVTADGYVVTDDRVLPDSDFVDVYLRGGRRVTGTVLGWSGEWSIGLIRIVGKVPWPHVNLGKVPDAKSEQLCLAMGYPHPLGHLERDCQPFLRLGCITKSAAPIWFTSSCTCELGDSGGGLFDLEGRLVGLTAGGSPYRDTEYVAVEMVQRHWDELAAGQDLDRLRLFSSEKNAGPTNTTDKTSQRAKQQNEISAAIKKAESATVRIVPGGRHKPWSGVVVTEDGYIVTCAHHHHLPGKKVSIHLSDGRKAAGKVLASNRLCDIGLVKITDQGSWPHVEFGNSGTMQPDDACLHLAGVGHAVRDIVLVRHAQHDLRNYHTPGISLYRTLFAYSL